MSEQRLGDIDSTRPRRTPFARLAWSVALLVGIGGLVHRASASDVAWYGTYRHADESNRCYDDMVVSSRYLTMRDGVTVAIDLFLPQGLQDGERLPTILEQNRYWRSLAVPWPFRLLFGEIPAATEKRRFVTHGYAWVEADVRGTGASSGNCPNPNFSVDQIHDGAEIVDWIIRQPWSDGKVGATGVSYGGMTSQLLLVNQHPAVKAVAPRFTEFDAYADIVFPGGVRFSALIDEWGRFTQTLDRDVVPNSLPAWMWLGGTILGVGVRPVDADRDRSMLAAAVQAHAANFDHYGEVAGLTYRDDVAPSGLCMNSISAHRYADDMRASGAAIYSQSGWLDGAYVHAAVKRYLTISNPGSRLLLGPWQHGGLLNVSPARTSPEVQFDQTGELLRFFDYHLRGIDTGTAAEPPVHYFTMGEEQWKAADIWPPPEATMHSYYFAANNQLRSDLDGTQEASDAYRVDQTVGTGHCTRWDGITGGGTPMTEYTDRRKADAKLLVYTSAPLERDTEVTGHPSVTLFVSSTAADGQFFVYLEDVDEHGRVLAITDGQLRAIHRKLTGSPAPYRDVVPYRSFARADAMPLEPGEIAKLVFDLLPTSYLYRQGHSLRIALAGADVDHFAPLFGDPPVVQVYRGGAHASRIDLPLIAH